MKQAVGFGDDMWAVGLMMGEMVTGRITIDRLNRIFRPVCRDETLLLEIVIEVANILGDDSPLLDMFLSLLHKDPAV